MGDVVAAVDRYQDIAPDVRARLQARMVKRDYDDVVSIRRDSITGKARARYGSAIRDMHFGSSKLCRSVSRTAWSAQMQERGLVYCDSGHCILVPTVCRNVSRIARAEVANGRADGDGAEPEAAPVAVLDLLPAPVPFDVAPMAFDGGGSGEGPPEGGRFFGGGVAGLGVMANSFASGSAGGRPTATIAAATGENEGPEQVFGAPPASPQVGVPIAPVPEPETWGLMIAGLVAVNAWRRRALTSSSRFPV